MNETLNMSTIKYNRLWQVAVKLMKQDLLSPTCVQLKKIVFGASCYNCIGASCYSCNNIRAARTDGSASELFVDNA